MLREDERLVAEHAAWLSALLRGLTRSEADAEDAYQDVWARVLKRGNLSSATSIRAYLAQTARAVVIDRYRRNCRMELSLDAQADEDTESAAERIVDTAARPDVRYEGKALRQEVLAAVRALEEGPRTVVLMRMEGELSFQEIADAIGAPLGTVLTWYRTAVGRLKARLVGR